MRLPGPLRRLLGGERVPTGWAGRLEPEEHVVATAEVAAGGHVVVTSRGLWVPEDAGPRRVGWHLVNRATWRDGLLVLVEAVEVAEVGGAVVLADRPPRRLRLVAPGTVPHAVRERVEGSIRSRHHRELSPGGAWFVQRRVPGRDGVVLQVRPDPGTEPAAVRALTAEVVRMLGGSGPSTP